MQNEAGEVVDVYIPRKCNYTQRIISAKDHASVQVNVAEVDEKTGRLTGNFKPYALCGILRRMVNEIQIHKCTLQFNTNWSCTTEIVNFEIATLNILLCIWSVLINCVVCMIRSLRDEGASSCKNSLIDHIRTRIDFLIWYGFLKSTGL